LLLLPAVCVFPVATHEPTGAKVAIKILNRRKLKKQDMGEKVRTEIHILRQFSHPHIIRLYEVIGQKHETQHAHIANNRMRPA